MFREAGGVTALSGAKLCTRPTGTALWLQARRRGGVALGPRCAWVRRNRRADLGLEGISTRPDRSESTAVALTRNTVRRGRPVTVAEVTSSIVTWRPRCRWRTTVRLSPCERLDPVGVTFDAAEFPIDVGQVMTGSRWRPWLWGSGVARLRLGGSAGARGGFDSLRRSLALRIGDHAGAVIMQAKNKEGNRRSAEDRARRHRHGGGLAAGDGCSGTVLSLVPTR